MVNPAGQIGSSINALIKEYTSIAHNLANISTTGYKRKINAFSRELMNKMSDSEEEALASGTIETKGVLDFSQGLLQHTGKSLDVAICGKGFFVIETTNGQIYTRNGVFEIDPATGQLVNSQGDIVAGAEGPIIIPKTASELDVSIGEDGSVSANGASIGKIRVVDLGDEESKLVSMGNSCFKAPEGIRVNDTPQTMLKQGYRENSNVRMMEELVDLITVSRLYESNMSILTRRRENSKSILNVANG